MYTLKRFIGSKGRITLMRDSVGEHFIEIIDPFLTSPMTIQGLGQNQVMAWREFKKHVDWAKGIDQITKEVTFDNKGV